MKILLVDIDSIIPNVALQKLQFYYEQKGNKVIQIKDSSLLPLFIDSYDKIYVSCIFTYNKHFCKKWKGLAEIGGSGYNVSKKLPMKIEKVKPRKNIGFTTRGCIRNCSWCIVQQKEGKCRVIGDIYDIWDGKAKIITLLDNNILGLPRQFFKISKQIKKEKLKVDFNSGFDHRLLTEKIWKEIISLSHWADWGGSVEGSSSKIRFAFDDILYKKSVKRALRIMQKNGLKDWQTRWYVYVGIKDTTETVLERINILRNAGQLVFLMRDRDKKVQDNLEFMKIYIWTSHIALFSKETYESSATKSYFSKQEIYGNRPTLF